MSNRSRAQSRPASDQARQSAPGQTSRPVTRRALRVAGAGLLAATAAIHLDLYLTGYRSIPVIGWLFLLQIIAAFGLALATAVSGHRLVAAAGAGFALSTLGGYLLSVWIGWFGFTEVPGLRNNGTAVSGENNLAADRDARGHLASERIRLFS